MTRSAKRKLSNKSPFTVSDGYTTVLPGFPSKILLTNPILITGFPDGGMIGSISMNHIIENLAMHQIASIRSRYIMPAAVFIGKRFRHPFRIYANDSGTMCAMLCEVPVIARGIFQVINTIVDWSVKAGTREILVLGGIQPTNFTPPFNDGRKPLLLQNQITESIKNVDEAPGQMQVPNEAIIVGLEGSLLSICATRGVKCTALMVPSLLNSPDPEGAAIILEALAKIPFRISIDTSRLREEAETVKKHR